MNSITLKEFKELTKHIPDDAKLDFLAYSMGVYYFERVFVTDFFYDEYKNSLVIKSPTD